MESIDRPSSSPVAADPIRPVSIRPMPSDDEVAAILAAHEALWPRPVMVVDEPAPRHSSWRFSGRWWSVPLPVRRDRPWM